MFVAIRNKPIITISFKTRTDQNLYIFYFMLLKEAGMVQHHATAGLMMVSLFLNSATWSTSTMNASFFNVYNL